MHEIQPVIEGPQRGFDGERYTRPLAANETISIHAPAAPAFLRLRMCWSPPGTAVAAKSTRLMVAGPAVTDGQALLDVGIGWNTYFVPINQSGASAVTFRYRHSPGDSSGAASGQLGLSSAAVVDPFTKCREQEPVVRPRMDMPSLLAEVRRTTDTDRTAAGDQDRYLANVEHNWEGFAQKDPLFYILTDRSKRDLGWDPDEFFATGEHEVTQALDLIDSRQTPLLRGRALDFGCGVGRLTQGLARHFDSVDGVDIAPSMIHAANRWNAFGDRVHYHANQRSDLSIFEPERFDFIYSSIVLQHVRTSYTRQYLREFIRILKPGGVLLFQLPSSPLLNRRGITLRLIPEKLRVHYLRWKQRKTFGGTMEFYWIHRRKVVRLLEQAGGVVDDSIRDYSAPAVSYRYCVRKPERAAHPAETNPSCRRAA